MKKRGTSLATVSLVIFLVVAAWLAQAGTVDAENARIVRLSSNVAGGRSYQIPFNVEPETLLIDKDTVVVWTLFGVYEARIVFLDGKKCEAATEAPVGFKLDSEATQACYRGALIPNGGTASLKFTEEGVYEYTIEWANQPKKTRAKVVVY